MEAEKNVKLEESLFERATQAAQAKGETVDELANGAVRRELLRRGLRTFVGQNRKDAEEMGLTEADVPRLVAESRAERRR